MRSDFLSASLTLYSIYPALQSHTCLKIRIYVGTHPMSFHFIIEEMSCYIAINFQERNKAYVRIHIRWGKKLLYYFSESGLLRGPTPFEDMIFYLWTDSNEICTAYVKLNSEHILFMRIFWFLIQFLRKLRFSCFWGVFFNKIFKRK